MNRQLSHRKSLLQGLALAVVALAPLTAVAGNMLYDSALVYYDFESLGSGSEVTDSGTAGLDLTASGAVSLVAGPAGGNAINLPDGIVLTPTVAGASDGVLDVTRDTEVTVAAWIKIANVGDGLYLASKSSVSPLFRGWAFQLRTDGRLQATWRYQNVAADRIFAFSTATIKDTDWHHIAMTFDYDATDTAGLGFKFYVDGVLGTSTLDPNAQGLATEADLSNTNPFTVSGRNGSQIDQGGSVDKFAFWKTALSAQAVSSLAVPEPCALCLLCLGGYTLIGSRPRKRA
jgi:Concanavalin A-like lectin/glucanases superfamily